nr:TonB family protein [Aminobacter anthyllidis]
MVVFASGCATKTAEVALVTDANGKLKSAQIAKTSGDPALDKRALGIARKRFTKVVPVPAKDKTYMQPVEFKLN